MEVLLVGLLIAAAAMAEFSRRTSEGISSDAFFFQRNHIASTLERSLLISTVLGTLAIGLLVLVLAKDHSRELTLQAQSDAVKVKFIKAEGVRSMLSMDEQRLPGVSDAAAAKAADSASFNLRISTTLSQEQARPGRVLVARSGSPFSFATNSN